MAARIRVKGSSVPKISTEAWRRFEEVESGTVVGSMGAIWGTISTTAHRTR